MPRIGRQREKSTEKSLKNGVKIRGIKNVNFDCNGEKMLQMVIFQQK